MNNKKYIARRAAHLCTRCGDADARTVSGRCLCSKCWTKTQLAQQKRYNQRKTNRLCVICGAQDSYTKRGKTLCFACAVKEAERHRASFRQKKTARSGNSEAVKENESK